MSDKPTWEGNGNVYSYFMEQSNDRLDRIEQKLEQLMAMRAQLLLVAAAASALISVATQYLIK